MFAEQAIFDSYLSSPDFYAGEASISIQDSLAGNQLAIADKIRSFRKLPNGWHYGTGEPISQSMAGSALDWLEFLGLLGYTNIDAFPGEGGEVLLSADFDDSLIEFILETNGTFSISLEIDGYEDVYYGKIGSSEAYNIISEIAGKEWSAFDYFTQVSLIEQEIDSLALPLRTLPGAESQLYHQLASLLYPQANVIISDNIIPIKQGTLQYSGSSIQTPFLCCID